MAQTSKTRYFFATNNDLHAEAEKKFLSELRRRLRWIDQNLKDGNVLDESSAHHISEIIDLVEIYITDEYIVL